MRELPKHILDLRKKTKAGTALQEPQSNRAVSPAAKETEALLSWQAPEYIKNENASDWLFGLALAGIGLLGWAIYTLNILFAAFVVAAFITILVMARRNPRIFSFRISREGIWIEDTLHPFHNLDSFWIFTFPEISILSLKPRSHFSGHIHILLQGIRHEDVRNALLQYLPEEEQHYSIVDWLSDRLHF